MYTTRTLHTPVTLSSTGRATPHPPMQSPPLADPDDPEAGLSSVDAIVMCGIVVGIVAVGVATLEGPINSLFQRISTAIGG